MIQKFNRFAKYAVISIRKRSPILKISSIMTNINHTVLTIRLLAALDLIRTDFCLASCSKHRNLNIKWLKKHD